MALKVAAWNVEGRLSPRTSGRRGSPTHILAGIRRLDADVVVLPEAYYETIAPGVDDALHRLGYHWYDARYDDVALAADEAGRPTEVHLRILSRLPLENVRRLRFHDIRTLMCATLTDPSTGRQLLVIATHLDDRAESLRMQQVQEVAAFIRAENMPTVMLGDFNAIWDGKRARIMRSRSVRRVVGLLPNEWLRSVATRFADMASGTTLDYLAAHAGLLDADPRRRATATPKLYGAEWLPSIRMAQLDHILISDDIVAGRVDIASDGGSDHRAIHTTIQPQPLDKQG